MPRPYDEKITEYKIQQWEEEIEANEERIADYTATRESLVKMCADLKRRNDELRALIKNVGAKAST